LNEAALDPPLAPYLAAWRKFRRETGFTPIAIEQRVVHTALQFAGTLDRRGTLRRRFVQIDIKSGLVPKSVGAQTAAYDEARRFQTREHARDLRYCAQLLPTGDYRLHALTDPADWPLFLSCLNVHQWRTRNVA
jgi:hypothetical protein